MKRILSGSTPNQGNEGYLFYWCSLSDCFLCQRWRDMCVAVDMTIHFITLYYSCVLANAAAVITFITARKSNSGIRQQLIWMTLTFTDCVLSELRYALSR